ncbi:hypothetical protein JL721_13167 [Aureococcus anophagefferens]|nr:hypothetical protein JL721_13167 [Aureococcus anophagefferens]
MSMREDGELLVLGDLAAASVERDDAGDVAMCYTEEMEEIMEKINNPTQLASVRADFDELLALGGGQETDAGIWRFLDRHAPAKLKERQCPIRLGAFRACACKTSFNTVDSFRRFVQHCANMGGRTEANEPLQSEHGRECRYHLVLFQWMLAGRLRATSPPSSGERAPAPDDAEAFAARLCDAAFESDNPDMPCRCAVQVLKSPALCTAKSGKGRCKTWDMLFQHCTSKKESGCWYHARVAAWLEASGKLVHQGSGATSVLRPNAAAPAAGADAKPDPVVPVGSAAREHELILPPMVELRGLPPTDRSLISSSSLKEGILKPWSATVALRVRDAGASVPSSQALTRGSRSQRSIPARDGEARAPAPGDVARGPRRLNAAQVGAAVPERYF